MFIRQRGSNYFLMIKPDSPCGSCIGLTWGKCDYVPASGTGENGVLLLGEAAGEHEALEGLGFVGKAGMFLFQNLQRAGISREGFKIDNVIHCRPPKNLLSGAPYEFEVIKNCAPLLDQTIAEMKQTCRASGKTFVIVPLGRIAFRTVMGYDDKSPELKKDYIGYIHWSAKVGAWVLPVYHPSYLMRGYNHLVPVLQFGVKRALEIADDGLKLDEPDYLLDPNPKQFSDWVVEFEKAYEKNPDLVLSYDIETPYKQNKDEEEVSKGGAEEDDDYTILRCSFSYDVDSAVSVVWDATNRPMLEKLFASSVTKCSWNGMAYDDPRIMAQMPINGDNLDGLLMWHVLNSALPKGLGFVAPFYCQNISPWKVLSDKDPARYNAADARVCLKCVLGIKKDLVREKLWDVFDRHVIEVHKVFSFMSEKGILVDQELRAKAEAQLSTVLDDIEEKMAAVVPPDVRKLKIWKKKPKVEVKGLIEMVKPFDVKYCQVCGLQKPTKTHAKMCPEWNVTLISEPQTVWGEPMDWKVSKQGLSNYQESLRHQAVISRREKKVTFDEKAIIQLVQKYPKDELYPLILQHRKMQKLLGTYIGITQPTGVVKGGLPLGPDGKVHCVFTSNPSTLRSACQSPNLQNQPRANDPDDPASIIRNLFTASTGNMFTATDFSGIEAKLVGYFAGAPDYIRLCNIDIHSFYTAYAVNALDGRIRSADLPQLSWSDDRLSDYLAHVKKEFKRDRNNLYKHLVHACVPGDHEVLTRNGWIRFDGLEDGTEIAEWNNNKLNFVTPSRVVRNDYSGWVESWKSRSISVKMTLQHKVPVYNSNGSLQALYIGGISESQYGWGKVPTTGVLTSGTNQSHADWLRLVVAIQADGTLYGNHVRFHLVKTRKRESLQRLLTKLGIKFSRTKCKDHLDGEHFGFNVKATPVFKYLSTKKVFSLEALMAVSTAERITFLDELPWWDGTRSGGKSGRQTSYMTGVKENAETVQTLAHITGRQGILTVRNPMSGFGSVKPIYYVSFNHRKFASLTGKAFQRGTESFTGKVYCVTVPSGWFLVRHNGLVSVTGNCNFGQGVKGAQEKILLETGNTYSYGTIKKVMDLYKELFPEIGKWQWRTLLQVEKDGYLRNPFGYIHRFSRPFEYERWGREWSKKQGPEANKIWAFLPQSTAAGIIKEAMLRLFQNRFEEAGQYLRLLIHDELFSEAPEGIIHDVRKVMEEEMTKPTPELRLPTSYGMGEFLVIGVESKIGNKWGSMKGV